LPEEDYKEMKKTARANMEESQTSMSVVNIEVTKNPKIQFRLNTLPEEETM
jgi:hypothetical protein